jgi:hypothetical protein
VDYLTTREPEEMSLSASKKHAKRQGAELLCYRRVKFFFLDRTMQVWNVFDTISERCRMPANLGTFWCRFGLSIWISFRLPFVMQHSLAFCRLRGVRIMTIFEGNNDRFGSQKVGISLHIVRGTFNNFSFEDEDDDEEETTRHFVVDGPVNNSRMISCGTAEMSTP